MEKLVLLSAMALSVTLLEAQGTVGPVPSTSQNIDTCPAAQNGCLARDDNVAVFPAPASGSPGNEIYIGGIFPVHGQGEESYSCGWVDHDSFQEMIAFYWAISTSSQRYNTAVPQATKGAVIFDTCSNDYVATQSILGVEKCKIRPITHETISNTGNVTSTVNVVDRKSILGYVNGVDGRNGQMETEASQLMLGINKPVINTGTYSGEFSRRKPGARNNFVSPTIKQQLEATLNVIRNTVTSQDVFIMVVYSDDVFSQDAFNELKTLTAARDICVVYESMLNLPVTESQIESTARGLLTNNHARFVLNLLSDDLFRIVYQRVSERTDNIFSLTFIFPPFAERASSVVVDSGTTALGAIKLRHKSGNYEDFNKFYRQLTPEKFPSVPFIAEFWQQRFACNIIGYNQNRGLRYRDFCSNSLTLEKDDITPRTAYVITATDALLMSIESVSSSQQSFDDVIPKTKLAGKPLFNQNTGGPAFWEFEVLNLKLMQNITKYYQVGWINSTHPRMQTIEGREIRVYTRSVNESNGQEDLTEALPESSCPPDVCEGCRPPPPPPVTVTRPPSDNDEFDPMSRIMASNKRLAIHRLSHVAEITGIHFQQHRPESNYTTRLYATDYRSIWSVALAALAGLGIIAVILLEISLIYLIMTYKFEEPDGKNRSHLNFRSLWLGQLLLFGIFLSYLTLFAYLPEPTKATCGITRFGIGISYAIIFSCLLVKLMVILHSRTAIPGLVNPNFQNTVGYMVSLFLIAFGVQLIIDIQWLIQVPPEAVLVKDNSGDLVWICNHFTWSVQHGFWNMPYFVRTEFENHLLSLIYIMFLILVTFLLSLKAFDIVANMRESRFITLATSITILIFIAWAKIGGFLRDHAKAQDIGDGCIGFGLFFTATVILFALFMPKVRQLVVIGMEGVFLEDDKETTYASSIYSPGTHRSFSGYADGSVIGMHTMDRSTHVMGDHSGINLPGDDSRPIINVDTSFMSNDPPYISNPHALHLIHPRSSGPSLYSVRSTPNLYDPSEVYSARGAKVTRNLTGRSYLNETFSGSEYPSLYRPKSEVLLYKHPRSEIGSL